LAEIEKIFELRGSDVVWRVNRGTRARAGEVAGTLDKDGYLRIRLDGRLLAAHRITFTLANGYDPFPLQIDHIDGDRLNNDPSNLRPVRAGENQVNRPGHRAGRLFGATRHRDVWRASVFIAGKRVYLGLFATEAMACLRAVGYLERLGLVTGLHISHRDQARRRATVGGDHAYRV
jgi:hypothetical protein